MSESSAGRRDGHRDQTTGPGGDDSNAAESDDVELRTRLELLRAENERLREEYVRARRASYRRAAMGLAGVGVVAIGGGILFPAFAETLFVLGAIGVFGAVLTYYLTPERFVAADTGERIYAALAETADDLTGQLGLQETRVYVPVEGARPARLFVPQRAEYEVPDGDSLDRPLVVDVDDSERGASFIPTGAPLFAEFERSLTGPLADSPTRLTEQVADALVEGFELADGVETDVDVGDGRATIVISGSAYGGADRFDNPLGSLLGVALARSLNRPVELEQTGSEAADLVVTCQWDAASAQTEE